MNRCVKKHTAAVVPKLDDEVPLKKLNCRTSIPSHWQKPKYFQQATHYKDLKKANGLL